MVLPSRAPFSLFEFSMSDISALLRNNTMRTVDYVHAQLTSPRNKVLHERIVYEYKGTMVKNRFTHAFL